jgi:sialic acid synthase
MRRELFIAGERIADDTNSWVIAEVGHNHQGDVEKCKQLFKAAKECGVNAVKLQKRDNRSLYTRAQYDAPYDNENSFGPTYGAHREALEFGWDEYVEVKRYANELGLVFFATTWDFRSTDFLAELGVPVFKIASGDLTNLPLLKYVARLGQPLIVSTGGGTLEDVRRVYDAVMPINPQLCLLQCTASYPVEAEDMNLNVICTYREQFPEVVVGLSDHQDGIALSMLAYTLGARVVEKHFTLHRSWKGTDHAFSLEPIGMQKMVRDLHRARVAMGDGVKRRLPGEERPLLKMSKKIVAARDLPVGRVLQPQDLALKSPGDGLPPYEWDNVVGKTLRAALSEDDAVTLDHLKA